MFTQATSYLLLQCTRGGGLCERKPTSYICCGAGRGGGECLHRPPATYCCSAPEEGACVNANQPATSVAVAGPRKKKEARKNEKTAVAGNRVQRTDVFFSQSNSSREAHSDCSKRGTHRLSL